MQQAVYGEFSVSYFDMVITAYISLRKVRYKQLFISHGYIVINT